jgi:hypothetical protein
VSKTDIPFIHNPLSAPVGQISDCKMPQHGSDQALGFRPIQLVFSFYFLIKSNIGFRDKSILPIPAKIVKSRHPA